MKQTLFALFAIALTIGISTSCKKSSGNGNDTTNTPGNNFSDSIKNIVPQAVIDSLRKWGMVIYDGQTPPTLAGIYLVGKDSCMFDNSGDHKAGSLFGEYKYRFSNQNNSKLTIRIDLKLINDPNGQMDNASDSTATFISGTGNNFTIFAEEKGVTTTTSGTSSYTELNIYSGQLTSSGIANFQYSIYMKNKNDPSHQLIAVGASRIFVDGDPGGLASLITTF